MNKHHRPTVFRLLGSALFLSLIAGVCMMFMPSSPEVDKSFLTLHSTKLSPHPPTKKSPQQSPQQKTLGSPKLVKINNAGKAISPWSGPWQCVYDRQTGLLWEAKTDDESIHDGYWTYSWFLSEPMLAASLSSQSSALENKDDNVRVSGKIGVENSGDCYFENQRCDTEDLIRRANQRQTCQQSNWRLPTETELKSLIYTHALTGEPLINKGYFPYTKRGDYWTSNYNAPLQGVYQYLHRGAIAVNFIDGTSVALPYRNAAFVRLVSDGFKSD